MRIGGLLERKHPADGRDNLAANREIEQFRQPGPQGRGGEEGRRGETGEGLVLEDQPEKVGDAEMTIWPSGAKMRRLSIVTSPPTDS